MDPVTVGVIIAVGVGTFALGAIVANLLHGREGRSLGAEYAEGVQDGREGERTRLEAVIKYHELLTNPEFRKRTQEEIAGLKRRVADEDSELAEERESLEEQIAQREAEVGVAEAIIAERDRRLNAAIEAAGVADDEAEAIRSAAALQSLLPLMADTLQVRRQEAEAAEQQAAKAEAMKRHVEELQAETVRLQMAKDETVSEVTAKSQAVKQQLAQVAELNRQLEDLQAETQKLEAAQAEAMARQQQEAEAARREHAKAEAMTQETGHLEVLRSFQDALTGSVHVTPSGGAASSAQGGAGAEEAPSPEDAEAQAPEGPRRLAP